MAGSEAGHGLRFLRLSSHAPLDAMRGRVRCSSCGGMRKWYCYDCLRYLEPEYREQKWGAAPPAPPSPPAPQGDTAPSTDAAPPAPSPPPEDSEMACPRVPLPVEVLLIQHPTEQKSKSTAVHAPILSPDATLVMYPGEVPPLRPEDGWVLVYPADDATPVEEWADLSAIRGLVFVDSKWANAQTVIRDGNIGLSALPRICMRQYETCFWRYQNGFDSKCLATIEAVYYMVREVATALRGGRYNGEVDDLLWLYRYQYDLIQRTYAARGEEHGRIKGWALQGGQAEKEAAGKQGGGRGGEGRGGAGTGGLKTT